jgi:nucleoside-diphosphate-sugar epimerase
VFNRAHVEDIAEALWASIQLPTEGEAFNIVDNEPAPPQDVLSYAADLLNLPPLADVNFATADMSPMARAFYDENKRVRNTKLKTLLGWQPRYPTYREGLKAILAQSE